jgi:multisubunit Na+/H+ antiporter MnhF subunit
MLPSGRRKVYERRMTKLTRIAAFAAIAVVVVLTLGPVGLRSMSPIDPAFDRALAYAVIGFLLLVSFPRHPWRVIFGVLALIVALEAGQGFRPDRHGRVPDVIEKTAGAGAGIAAAAGALWMLRRRRVG